MKPIRYLSVCSGVEAASQAWMPLGWEAVAFSEIEPFPCAVLASRFPNVPNLGDMSRIHYDRNTKELYNDTTRIVCRDGIDLLVGGTPCQSFSVAGKRAGLEGASGLAYHYARLIGEIRPRWFVWENVPGALSSVTYGDQRDFNFLLQQFGVGGNADLGLRWNLCWRVLDTQYVRVESFPRAIPQRRRRVFVVGHLAADCGGGCEVLLEPEGVRGNTAPRRVKGQGVAGDIEKGAGGADGEERDSFIMQLRQGKPGGGKGPLVKHEHAPCLGTTPVETAFCSYGINPQNGSLMVPRTKEVGQTNAVGHENGVAICSASYDGYNQRAWDEVAFTQRSAASGTEGNDADVKVAISFKGGQSSDGGLGVDEGACKTMQSKMSAVEPTVAIGVKFGEMVRLSNHEQVNREQMPTLSKSDGKAGDNTPTVAIRTANTHANGENEPYNIMTCDGGSHKRGDRPNGGMYIRKADAANCIASSGNGDTVVVSHTMDGANGRGVAVEAPICFQQNQRCEARDLGGAAGALQSEAGMKQQNYVALPVAMRGNRTPADRGKFPETDGSGAAYSLTSVQTDSMVAIGVDPYNSCSTGEVSKTLNTAVAQDTDHTGAVAVGTFCDTGHGDYWSETGASGTIRSEGENRPSRPSNVVAIGINCQGGSTPTVTHERTDTITAAANSSGNDKMCVAIGIGRDALRGRPWDGDCNPTLTQSNNSGGIGASNQELFAQNFNGLVVDDAK